MTQGLIAPPQGLGGVTDIADLSPKDHDLLDGLTDDDHTQYGLLAGRSGGQVLVGGTDAADSLTLRATANATPGAVLIETEPGVVVARALATGQFLIGAAAAVSTQILRVVGGARFEGNADENQVVIKANGTQTASILTIQTSAAATLLALTGLGELVIGASALESNEFMLVKKLFNGVTKLRVSNVSTGNAASVGFEIAMDGGNGNLLGQGTNFTPTLGREADSLSLQTSSLVNGLILQTTDSAVIKLKTNATLALTIDTSQQGNWVNGIGVHGVTAPGQASKISDPSGGATVDAESRTAINAIIDVLEGIGHSAAA